MITIVEGRPGMGKSVFLVCEILRYLRQGKQVYTNVRMALPKDRVKWIQNLHFIESLEDIVKLREGKIVLDEVQIYLNSRNWDKLDIRFQLLLQQHRKRGLDILGACQSLKRADVVFRELVQVFYRVWRVFAVRIPFTPYSFGFFMLREADPDTIEGANVRSYEYVGWLPTFVLADPFTLDIYDTTQEYSPVEQVGRRYREEYIMIEKPSVVRQLVSKEPVI